MPVGIDTEDRAELGISITRLEGKETASPPTLSNINEALSTIIGEKICPSTNPYFTKTEAYTGQEAAPQLGVSARYGGFGAKLDAAIERKEYHNTVVVYLRQHGFTAQCDMEPPGSFFGDSFTETKLQALVDRGVMSSKNPPLIVSEVHYGRIVIFTLTSSSSETEINAALQASFSGFGSEISTELKTRYKNVFNQSKMTIIGKGVPEEVLQALVSGDYKNIFPTEQTYRSYVPLGYTVRTLNGEDARLGESTTYDAVSWDGMQRAVTLTLDRFAGGFGGGSGTDNFWVTLDGKDHHVTMGKPAVAKRIFASDGTGEPFRVTRYAIGEKGDWREFPKGPISYSPKERGWFSDNGTLAIRSMAFPLSMGFGYTASWA
ncbi:thiol-activated cytolysin family protein [Streptomyces roseifaciens]|uniref:thiol-activated cytolysin family protein n=1 Tax=Streptomyces roseifaciens TaxID=1488406 RepID=UPI0007180701|nr:thiol-activated cytolysin family protein [Streptomyces roseifaciens]